MTWDSARSRSGSRACSAAMSVIAVVSALVWSNSALSQERLRIVATTTDLHSLAEAVGGKHVAVTSLVPPNADPEEYQPRPQDLLRVKAAQIVVRVGLDFDLWFDRLLKQSGIPQIARGGSGYVDASTGIAVLEVRGASAGGGDGHAHGNGNPHYWLDPQNAEIITANILQALARVDPEGAAEYDANRRAFLQRLAEKMPQWQGLAGTLSDKPLLAYHNSWVYLARRFKLDFVGAIEQKPGVPPSPQHLARLIRLMGERKVRIIVREPREPEKDARFLQEKTGAVIVPLAASVGSLAGAQDYFSLFDTNFGALHSAARTP